MNPLYINVSPSSSKAENVQSVDHGYEDVPHTEIVFPNFYHTEPLGQGAYGAVVKCRFRARLAAAKIAQRKVEYADIHHEARLLHEFKHENIIELYAAFHGTQSGLVLELMEGGSLHEMLHQQKHVIYQACHVLGWALQVTSALSYLHSRGYVHRDLKPSNMLLTGDYKTLKLCDFGTANDLRTTMTNNRGTAMFMAPEVFRGRKYDQKCDIFSLGILLWEMITRRRPFTDWNAANPYAVLWQMSNGKRPNRIDGCPEPVMELIERCWADVPADRPYVDEVKNIIAVLCEIFPNHLLPLIDITTGEPVQAGKEERFVEATDSLPQTYPPAPARVGLLDNNTRASLPPPHLSDVSRGHRRGASYDYMRLDLTQDVNANNSTSDLAAATTSNTESTSLSCYIPNTTLYVPSTYYEHPQPNARWMYNPCLTSLPPSSHIAPNNFSHIISNAPIYTNAVPRRISESPAQGSNGSGTSRPAKKHSRIRKLFSGFQTIKKGFCD